MDVTEALTRVPSDRGSGPTEGACPDCRGSVGTPGPVVTASLPGRPLRRCVRCDTVHTIDDPVESLRRCCRCGLPFLATEVPGTGEEACPVCRDAPAGDALRDPDVVRATEGEVRAALQTEWRFVGSTALSAYLDRLTRQLRPCVSGRVSSARVEVFEDDRWWTLALPSGTILLSTGTLKGLEDEAELVFVLAHELFHAAAIETEAHLARMGLQAVSRSDGVSSPIAWSQAAHDIVRFGYGTEREREADENAFRVVIETGYDPAAVRRYLRRLDAMVSAGDTRVADLALAHPLPGARLRRLERFVSRVPAGGPTAKRTNREVFRRAVGGGAPGSSLRRVDGLRDLAGPAPRSRAPGVPRRDRLRLVLLVAALIVAGGVALWWFLLQG